MGFDWLVKMIFSHVKNIVFLRVFEYDFSQWPKTLYNTDVYEIKCNMHVQDSFNEWDDSETMDTEEIKAL